MLNSNDWHETHGQFLIDSQALLFKSEECLSHLELFGEDEDAATCLPATLNRLSELAANASVDSIADFSRQLAVVLERHGAGTPLPRDALLVIKSCLTLMSWQLELIDPRTGELPMDGDEQRELLDRLADTCSVTDSATNCAIE
ncbi:MAG: hypothetical protein K0R45_1750 [Pseudomonas sp.]|nr:hypothetical protein [Pseudomonas sp.]